MRHRVAGHQLNRSSKHRKALFKNLTASLIRHGHTTTTHTKAKIIKRQIDKLITIAKKGNLHSRRQIHAYFNQKDITHKLVDTIAPALSNRNSGYTRITSLSPRRGDNSPMAKVEFIDPIITTPTPIKPTKSNKSDSTKSASKTKASQ